MQQRDPVHHMASKEARTRRTREGSRFQHTLHKPTLNGLLLSSFRLHFLKVPVAISNNSLATKASTLGPLGVFKIHTLAVSVSF